VSVVGVLGVKVYRPPPKNPAPAEKTSDMSRVSWPGGHTGSSSGGYGRVNVRM
jgi:hypothetical protein